MPVVSGEDRADDLLSKKGDEEQIVGGLQLLVDSKARHVVRRFVAEDRFPQMNDMEPVNVVRV